MKKDLAQKFILACQEAEGSFEEWVSSLEEADLKRNFRTLAVIRDHLQCAREKGRSIMAP